MADESLDIDLVSVELDSSGRASGVEAEIEEPEAFDIREPFDPEKIDVITRNPTVDLLLSRVRTKRIDLQPDFQRKAGIWTPRAKSRLIESLLLRVPLPTLYAAEADDENWVIVDGIQRLTAIAEFMDAESIGAQPLRLTNLEYLSQSEGLTYDELPGRLQTRLRESELVLHLIRIGTPEAVKFNIFARINTGGLPLSAQELRHALIPGQAREYLKILADQQSFKDATGKSIRNDRMADREMVLRFCAFRLRDPEQYASPDFDSYLRNAMYTLNNATEPELDRLQADFEHAMEAAHAIFGSQAFRKRNREHPSWRLPINKALFESVSVNLANLSNSKIKQLVAEADRVERGLLDLLARDDFLVAISQGTGDIAKVRRRFREIRLLFEEISA